MHCYTQAFLQIVIVVNPLYGLLDMSGNLRMKKKKPDKTQEDVAGLGRKFFDGFGLLPPGPGAAHGAARLLSS